MKQDTLRCDKKGAYRPKKNATSGIINTILNGIDQSVNIGGKSSSKANIQMKLQDDFSVGFNVYPPLTTWNCSNQYFLFFLYQNNIACYFFCDWLKKK